MFTEIRGAKSCSSISHFSFDQKTPILKHFFILIILTFFAETFKKIAVVATKDCS